MVTNHFGKDDQIMTPKELNYVEDALGHETFMKAKCSDTASQIQDPELKKFAEKMAVQHEHLFSKFMNLV